MKNSLRNILIGLLVAGASVAYSLDGRRLDNDTNPVGLVAAALTARSTNDDTEATQLLEDAESLQNDHPTYYGAAWLALGEQLLKSLTGQRTVNGSGRSLRLISARAPQPAQVRGRTSRRRPSRD
jgi:hypothetical protein